MCLSPNPEAGPFSCSRQREKGKGESWREDEWRESSGGMESKGICNANSCPATLNNSKCWMEILLFWSLVINFCRSGPFSFGLFWPAHLPFCTTPPPPPPPTIRSHPLLQFFCSCPLYLFVFRNHFLPLLIHRNSARLLPSRFPLRSSSLISLAASFLPNCLKRIARRRKEAPLCFMALISLYSWSVDYTLPAAMGDTDGEPLWGPLSKLFLLKERRERIISHLLNIRFIHNAPGVFIEWELLLLLIAAMVAAVELVSCAPSFVSPSHPSLEPHFWNWCYNALRLPLSPPRWKILFLCFAFVYFFAFNVLLSLSVCCFIPHWAERELNILFDGLEPERFWIIHSRLLMCLSATGVSYAPDSGFLLVTESPQTLQSHS